MGVTGGIVHSCNKVYFIYFLSVSIFTSRPCDGDACCSDVIQMGCHCDCLTRAYNGGIL